MSERPTHQSVGQPIAFLVEPYWEKQKYESHKAFRAFVIYRDLPDEIPAEGERPQGRSFAEVARRLSCSEQNIRKFSWRWRWPERIDAYEAEKDRERLEKLKKARDEDLERTLTIARGMKVIAGKGIQQLLEMLERDDEVVEFSPKDLTLLFETGLKAELLLAGKATETVRHITPADEAVTSKRDALDAIAQTRAKFPTVPLAGLVRTASEAHGVPFDELMAELNPTIETQLANKELVDGTDRTT